jgi:hypothetical protein
MSNPRNLLITLQDLRVPDGGTREAPVHRAPEPRLPPRRERVLDVRNL